MYSLIYEISSVSKHVSDLTILQESYDKETGVGKVKFKTILQTAEELNANRRYYSKKICSDIVEGLKPIAEARSLLQEIDHPFVLSSDKEIQKSRASRVELTNCGSLISKIKLDGNNIIAECETLTGFRGPDLYNLIVKDKANIGFSVRMFGKLNKHPTIQEAMEVSGPIKAITYDVVSNPSHKKARIIEFLPESMMEFGEGEMITENDNGLLINENIKLISNSHVSEYLSMLLSESFKIYNNKLQFNI